MKLHESLHTGLPPQGVFIAGPNGSGKSTCAKQLVPKGIPFVNADLIAQKLAKNKHASANLKAGRLLIHKLNELENALEDFAVETTLATKKLPQRIKRLKQKGYEIHLIFLWLPSEELAIKRVAARVRMGGHQVPENAIRRRFKRGLYHFLENYCHLVHTWRIYDNSKVSAPELIAYGDREGNLNIRQNPIWKDIINNWTYETTKKRTAS